MGRKKIRVSGFTVFLRKFMKAEQRAGRFYPKSEWANIVDPHWRALSQDERQEYKDIAKTLPPKWKKTKPKNCLGIPLEQYEYEQGEIKRKHQYMVDKVKCVVNQGFSKDDINVREFHFIMANYFYKTSNFKYPPAEIAAAKFTFQNGIKNCYHTYVNPGTIDFAYAFEAKDRSEKVHRLPTPGPHAFGQKDYNQIYTDFMKNTFDLLPGQTFAMDDPNRPFIFTLTRNVNMIESVLDQLSDFQWRQTFDVFDFELLFYQLKNKVSNQKIPMTITNTFVEQDRYDTLENISCDFHEKEDVTRHCALSCVRRWCFLLGDHICMNLGIKLIAGVHVPANAALDPQPVPPDDDDFAMGAVGGGVLVPPNVIDVPEYPEETFTGYEHLINDTDDSGSDDSSAPEKK